MLPSINRIRKKKDFETIFKNSKSVKTSLFIFRVAKNNLNISRFGFIVSQKISKKATIRNKVRRRMSKAVADRMKIIKQGLDIVFIALSGIEKKDFSGIDSEIEKSFLKEKLIIENKKAE